uniref:Uncharacterized protein n=1 Tax=Ananas comosus var. bracteatus TaxID=296719 RepID=A0A6V7PFM1_ANACO|nr:unnamed protein product [Ananas comosus var. bracteatus]
MVSLDLTAKLGDAELAELLELRDGVGKVWIGVGVGVGEAAAKVAEMEAAVVWGEEVDEGAPRLDLHGDGVPAPRAVAANGAGEEELLLLPPDLLTASSSSRATALPTAATRAALPTSSPHSSALSPRVRPRHRPLLKSDASSSLVEFNAAAAEGRDRGEHLAGKLVSSWGR